MDHLDLDTGGALKPLYFEPSVKFTAEDDFFAFPSKADFRGNENTGEIHWSDLEHLNGFLQQWLFFGLLRTVLQDDDFDDNHFITNGVTTPIIDTKRLHEYLTNWETRANRRDNELTMRMIKAQLALDKAREVVMVLCSMKWDDWNDDTDPHIQPSKVDANLALSLMVLGETLTNAKSLIVERVGFAIRGWHGDAREGWGIPSAVINLMVNRGWCVRTIYVLSCQLRSHVGNRRIPGYSARC
jgi:hypothetical protein